MDKKIEAAIRETLVIQNPQSIWRAVDKLKLIVAQQQALHKCDCCTLRELLEQKMNEARKFVGAKTESKKEYDKILADIMIIRRVMKMMGIQPPVA